jgi:hypothetical protein
VPSEVTVAVIRAELLFTPDCPHAERAEALLHRILAEEGVAMPVERVPVVGLDQAAALGFAGSPTIRVDGVDVEPGADGFGAGVPPLPARGRADRDGAVGGRPARRRACRRRRAAGGPPVSAAVVRRARSAGTAIGLILLVALSGCVGTRTPFSRTALDAASTISAAATTLQFAHAGRLTREYAQGSFVSYRAALAGVTGDLPDHAGAPDAATVERLIDMVADAEAIVMSPCLDEACDWRSQVDTLVTARDALLEAGG